MTDNSAVNEVYFDFERYEILKRQEEKELNRLKDLAEPPKGEDFVKLNQIRNEISMTYQKYAYCLDIAKQVEMQRQMAEKPQTEEPIEEPDSVPAQE